MSEKALTLLSSQPSPYVANESSVTPDASKVYAAFRDNVLARYMQRTPYAIESLQALKEDGATILNDHVALRTFKDEKGSGGRSIVEKLFLAYGYKREDDIPIDALHLDCTWYEPPQESNWPKIFISEQQVERLPPEAQQIIYRTIGGYYSGDPFVALGLDKPESVDPAALADLLENPPWNPTSADYDRLLALAEEQPEHKKALQFSAWTLVHGHRWNHLTILQNSLGLASIEKLEDLSNYLKEKGFPLNESGGRIVQGSAEVFLKQSSTIANQGEHTFADGVTRQVPGSFVEFIERFMRDDKPVRGFLAANAQGIFSSTDARKDA